MDYEKKYKKALERARKLKENPQSVFNEYSPKEGDTICDYIFPELRESEDERIRKELIEHVKDQQSTLISAPDCRDKYEEEENNKYNVWIAWLEKQGKRKSTEILKWSAQEEYCICELEAMVKEAWRKAENVRNDITIKKMQELMFFLKTLNPNKKPQRIISAETKEAMYGKPACVWSEEDGRILKGIIGFISHSQHYGVSNSEMLNWLKSLKQRIGE